MKIAGHKARAAANVEQAAACWEVRGNLSDLETPERPGGVGDLRAEESVEVGADLPEGLFVNFCRTHHDRAPLEPAGWRGTSAARSKIAGRGLRARRFNHVAGAGRTRLFIELASRLRPRPRPRPRRQPEIRGRGRGRGRELTCVKRQARCLPRRGKAPSLARCAKPSAGFAGRGVELPWS